MSRWGKVDYRQLEALQRKLDKLAAADTRRFCEEAARELAARLLAKVIKRTPVGKYKGDEFLDAKGRKKYKKYKTVSFTTGAGKKIKFQSDISGEKGGTLRRGWTAKTETEARSGGNPDAAAYARGLPVTYQNGTYQIEIINPVRYAPYVEFGHRTPGGAGWVNGRYMLTISEKELQAIMPALLEQKLTEFLKGCLDA